METALIKKEKDFLASWAEKLSKKKPELLKDNSFSETARRLIHHILDASNKLGESFSQEEFFSLGNLIKYIISMQEHKYTNQDIIHFLESLLDTTNVYFDEHASKESDTFKNILTNLLTFIRNQYSNELLLQEKIHYLEARNPDNTLLMVGSSSTINKLLKEMEPILDNNVSVLIEGETGTGKELLARAIHRNSHYSEGPFIALNCAAIPHDLVESELFGFKKGAFTDASTDKIGKFELANKGILFLDEINELPLPTQSKLLRVLQERKVVRLGESKERDIDIKLVCATNKNLKNLVTDGKFRQDFYYRINVYSMVLPPLKERQDDIIPLAEYFIEQKAKEFNKSVQGLTVRAKNLLKNYPWPGNIRELENVMTRAVLKSFSRVLDLKDLDIYYPLPVQDMPASTTLKDMEKQHIARILQKNQYNIQRTAKELGITRTTLYNKMKEYQLETSCLNSHSDQKLR